MLLDEGRPYDFDRVFRLVVSVGTLLGLFFLVRYLAEVLIPFVAALLAAYLVDPIVRLVQRRVPNRVAAVLITVLGMGLLVAGLLAILVPIVVAELKDLNQLASQLRQEGSDLQRRIRAVLEAGGPGWFQFLVQWAEQFVTSEQFVTLAADMAQRLAPGLRSLLTGVYGFLAGLAGVIIFLLYLVFLLIDFGGPEGRWQALLPPRYRQSAMGFLNDFNLIMRPYFRGQFIVAMLTGVLFAIGFSILGLRLAVLLGLGIGLLNMVPYLQLVGVIPAVLLSVVHSLETPGSSIWLNLLWLAVVFGVVQLIQDGFLVPRIMGQVTGLRPVMILLGLFVWAKLLGFLGLVLAIPLTCLGIAYYRRYVLGEPVTASAAEEPQSGPSTRTA